MFAPLILAASVSTTVPSEVWQDNYAQGMRTCRKGVILSGIGFPIWGVGVTIVKVSEAQFDEGVNGLDFSSILTGGAGVLGGGVLDITGAIMLDVGSAQMAAGSLRSATAVRQLGGHVSHLPGYGAWFFWGASAVSDLSSFGGTGGAKVGNWLMAGSFASSALQMDMDTHAWRHQLKFTRAVELWPAPDAPDEPGAAPDHSRPAFSATLVPITARDHTGLAVVGSF